jgi:hypothetical protein
MMDKLVYDENMERLNRFYYKKEHKKKTIKLTEYYKFHIEIPRLFMLPVVKIVNSHHNKKRRLKYYEVFYIYKGKKVNELTCRGIKIIK